MGINLQVFKVLQWASSSNFIWFTLNPSNNRKFIVHYSLITSTIAGDCNKITIFVRLLFFQQLDWIATYTCSSFEIINISGHHILNFSISLNKSNSVGRCGPQTEFLQNKYPHMPASTVSSCQNLFVLAFTI